MNRARISIRHGRFQLRRVLGAIVSGGWVFGVAATSLAGDPAGFGVSDQWSHFLGPHYDGVSSTKAFDPKGLTKVWSRDVGSGCSSVTLVNGQLFTMGNRDDRDVVYCLRADTGADVWTADYACERMPKLYDGGPNATPTIANGQVFTLSRTGLVQCFDAGTGKSVWAADAAQWSPKGGWWGFSDSPVIWDDKVFLNITDMGLALDLATGKILWSGTEAVPSYTTLLPLPEGNPVTAGPALVIQTCRGLSVVAPDTGQSLLAGTAAEWTAAVSNNNGVSPKVYGRDLIVMHGSRGLSRISRQADGTWIEKWVCADLIYDKGNWFTFNRQVIHGQYLYAIAGNAKEQDTRLACVDLESGTQLWSKPEVFGNLLLAGDTLMLVTQDGDVAWGSLEGQEYHETFRQKMVNGGKGGDQDGPYWSHPVLHGGHLYLRSNKGKLTCFRVE